MTTNKQEIKNEELNWAIIRGARSLDFTWASFKRLLKRLYPGRIIYWEGFFYEIQYQMHKPYHGLMIYSIDGMEEFNEGRLAANKWLRNEINIHKPQQLLLEDIHNG